MTSSHFEHIVLLKFTSAIDYISSKEDNTILVVSIISYTDNEQILTIFFMTFSLRHSYKYVAGTG